MNDLVDIYLQRWRHELAWARSESESHLTPGALMDRQGDDKQAIAADEDHLLGDERSQWRVRIVVNPKRVQF